jgi:methylthioribose-1-phosphate isomerase
MLEPLKFEGRQLYLLDQRALPFEAHWIPCASVEEVASAIQSMVVRGAPAIGVTAAYGMVLALQESQGEASFQSAEALLRAARPTAVNLGEALDHMATQLQASGSWTPEAALAVARTYHADDLKKNKAIGKHGASFLPGKRRVLTHCNTGSLATSGWGTALGIIRELAEQGRLVEVVANETRPFLQGARLTVYECLRDHLPVRLATDGMGGYLMSQGLVDCVIVGADRIAANGDTANKIGTFPLALAAHYHRIPFIVAAPSNTVDPETEHGGLIPIEQRPEREVTHVFETRLVQEGVSVYNPAFDVTPSHLISAIITEEGIHTAPYAFQPREIGP